MFRDCCAPELNNTASLPLDSAIRASYQVIKCGQSPIYLASSSHIFAIVAVVEVEVGRQHMPMVDFREFQECEVQNNASCAKAHIQRRDSEVGMVFVFHLVGRLEDDHG